VTPRFDPRLEQWPGVAAAQWTGLYERAEKLLGVGLAASAGSRRQDLVLRALTGHFPSARPVPVAARRRTENPRAVCWTGPAEILAGATAAGSPGITVVSQHAVRRLRHRGDRVLAADAVALDTGEPVTISADVFVVAAGGIRTPALLWVSEIAREDGDRSALGRYLYDHPLAYAQIVLDRQLAADGLAWPDPDPFVIIPVSADRPFHALLLCDGCDARVLEGSIDDRLVLSLYWYSIMAPRFENRISFSDRSVDAVGLPQPTFDYSLSPQDRAGQRAALDDLRAAGRLLGTFLPISPPQLLSPGSSLHIMGTTRMGEHDDGHSVADSCGRVWRFANLYLGGTGLIPCQTAANPTLTACAIAVRTADRIAGTRGDLPSA
jgi:choline dehydrogenase-like flavoprotein